MLLKLLPMLFVLFLGLKIANVIIWSWWLVCMPLIAWFIAVFINESIKAVKEVKRKNIFK